MKKINVSIGIPAYNEEANIKPLLLTLLAQKQSNFNLKEIIVVSDQSTDNTISEIKSIKSKKIILIQNRKRIGQALSQNKILDKFRGDLLVLLNADVLPENELLIQNLTAVFKNKKNVGIIGGRVLTSNESTTFIEKVINFSGLWKESIYKEINHGNNLYLCHGRVRAFSREFAKKFQWKPVYGEDAFSYFSCISSGYKFFFAQKATVYYRSPTTFTDHLKQSTRFMHSRENLEKYFNKNLISKSYEIPKVAVIKKSIKFFLLNPLLFSSYIYILSYSIIKSKLSNSTRVTWDVSKSSKILSRA